jgi:hypothetical protein
MDAGDIRESADVRVKKALAAIKRNMEGGRMSPMGFAKYVPPVLAVVYVCVRVCMCVFVCVCVCVCVL